MALTQEQIQRARAKIGLTPPPTVEPEMKAVESRVNSLRTAWGEPTKPVQPETKGIIKRGVSAIKEAGSGVIEDFKKRGEKLYESGARNVEEMSNADTAMEYIAPAVSTGLSTVGAVAGGAADIVGEGIKALYKTVTPESVQKSISEGVHKVLTTALGQEGLEKVSEGVDAYNEWRAVNPKVADALESVMDIGALFGTKAGLETTKQVVKGATKAVVPKVKNVIARAQESKVASGVAKESQKALESVTPSTKDLTPSEYADLLRKQKITHKTKTKPSQYVHSPEEKAIAEKFKSVLQDKDPVENSMSVMNEVVRRDVEVGKFLEKNNGIFTPKELKNYIGEKIGKVSDITVPDSKMKKLKQELLRDFMLTLKKNDMKSLWESRKMFDSRIEEAFAGSPTLQKDTKKAFRNAVQDFISERTPNLTYKEMMRDMSQLFDLHDIISVKATKEKGLSALQKWAKDNPQKVQLLKAGAGVMGVGLVGNAVF